MAWTAGFLETDLAKQEIQLLNDGLRYYEVAQITDERDKTIAERNRVLYKVNIYDAFRRRVSREGIPNRLDISDYLGGHFAGFFDGEGAFIVWHRMKGRYHEYRTFIQIGLRDDDIDILKQFQERFGGSVLRNKRTDPNANPSANWRLSRVNDLAEQIIPLFDQYPLQTKKAREYPIWRKMLIERYIATLGGWARPKTPDHFPAIFADAIKTIQSLRQYPG